VRVFAGHAQQASPTNSHPGPPGRRPDLPAADADRLRRLGGVHPACAAAQRLPQLAAGDLHIAHVLWGGLLLFAASLLPLVLANRWCTPRERCWPGPASGSSSMRSVSSSPAPTTTSTRRRRHCLCLLPADRAGVLADAAADTQRLPHRVVRCAGRTRGSARPRLRAGGTRGTRGSPGRNRS